MTADPLHPDRPVTVRLTPTDISGGGSTIGDELTVGEASRLKALANAFGPSQGGTSLLARYAEMQRQRRQGEAAATTAVKAAQDARDDTETQALKRSKKKLRKHLLEGATPARAAVLAHQHYKKHGGRSGMEVWSRKVAQG